MHRCTGLTRHYPCITLFLAMTTKKQKQKKSRLSFYPPLGSDPHSRARKRGVERFAMALKRLGATPANQLRWVLSFSQSNFGDTESEERQLVSEALRTLALSPFSMPEGLFGVRPSREINLSGSSFTLTEIEELQGGIGEMLAEMIKYPGRVQLPVDGVFLERRPASKDGAQIGITWQAQDEKSAILLAVAGLILQTNRQLRACKQCHTPFIAQKRALYCSAYCSQRAHNLNTGRIKDPEATRRRVL